MPPYSVCDETRLSPARARLSTVSVSAACPLATAERRDAALELGHPLLEDVVGGVHDPGVDVPELPEAEEIGRVVGAVEHVAGGGIDRHGARVGGGIHHLTRVNGERFRMIGHDNLLGFVRVTEMQKARST